MVSPRKIAFVELAALGEAENLRQRPGRHVALQPLHGAGRENEHAMRRLAAEHFLPGEGGHVELGEIEPLRESGGGRVADRQALAIRRDKIGVWNAHARCRAVPGENDIMVEIDLAQVGQFAIGRRRTRALRHFQLLYDVGRPVVGKTFPGQRRRRRGRRAATTAPFRPRQCPTPARCRCDNRRARAKSRASVRSRARACPCRPWPDGSGQAPRRRDFRTTIPAAWRKDRRKNGDLTGAS